MFEVFIEASDEFLKKDEKYVKQMYRVPEGQAVTGLHVDLLPGKGELRRVVLTTTSRIMHFVGKVARHGHSDSTPIFTKLFDGEAPGEYLTLCTERTPANLSRVSIVQLLESI